MKPYEARYEAATDRALAAFKAGVLSEAGLTARLGRLRARRDEEAAKWARADRSDAKAAYRRLTPEKKIRARLAFRANRPRTT